MALSIGGPSRLCLFPEPVLFSGRVAPASLPSGRKQTGDYPPNIGPELDNRIDRGTVTGNRMVSVGGDLAWIARDGPE
jgi:hypothetical protein